MTVREMSLEELYAVGDRQREENRQCGMSPEGIEYLTHSWIAALVTFQDLPVDKADAMRKRWTESKEDRGRQ